MDEGARAKGEGGDDDLLDRQLMEHVMKMSVEAYEKGLTSDQPAGAGTGAATKTGINGERT